MLTPIPLREDQLAWLRLTLVPGISVATQHALIEVYKTAERALAAPRNEIAAAFGADRADRLAKGPPPQWIDAVAAWLEEPSHHVITMGDSEYPKALREIAAAPFILYAKGRVELLNQPAVAIVGSRNASPPGLHDADAFAFALSQAGLTIVSGLALGIDAAAHRGGLRGRSSSIAVMGTGADDIYPRRNRALAEELATAGLLVSEFPLRTPPAKENFPRRNRLISGLARGVLVVEAATESGSLITARYALEQNRDVFAIPGSIHSPLSKGCHRLIKDGAKLVESAADILDDLGFDAAGAQAEMPSRLDTARDPLLSAMGYSPVSIDELAERTGAAAGPLAARLALLEIEGAVCALAGGLFQRCAPTDGPGPRDHAL
jgi:DNA processing protein